MTYLGYNGDGHFGRVNLTTSLYFAFGETDPGVFVDEAVDIEAAFFAVEVSMDFDWFRPRLSFLYGSGDDDPYDDKATGFDAIFENPQFAGSDSSYWIRQNVPRAPQCLPSDAPPPHRHISVPSPMSRLQNRFS